MGGARVASWLLNTDSDLILFILVLIGIPPVDGV